MMMRRIFSLFLLMAFTINICAIDELQIKPHQTIAGLSDESDDAYIELYLVNESFDIANLQFDILLPEGMEYADYGEFTDRVPSTTKKGNKTYDFSYQTNALEDGYTRFMFIPGGEMRKIEKGSGTILYINFKTNANMAAGIHPILMKNIKLVESTTSAITIDDVSSYVIIGDNNPLKTETDINMSSLIGSIPSFVVQAINADIASNAGLKYIDLTGADALGADFVMPNDQAKIVVKEGSPLANLSYAVTSKEPAVEGIAINETNFPDANFRSNLLSEDYGSDGVITDAEIAEITYIWVDEKNISNLKGIEFFTALETLYCNNNQLTSLDITKNTALTRLECSNNQLTALDVSKNSELVYLQCSNNQLTSLDIAKNTALAGLYCSNNQLTALDVSKNTELWELECSSNQLTALDVSKNTNLTKLYCSNNQLTSLNVLGCTALIDLFCSSNQLTSLDVTGCTSLGSKKELSIERGMILCALNRIKGAAMDAFIASLPANAGELMVIYHQDEGNVMTAAQVAAARAKGWKPMAYNETYNTWLSYLGEGVPEPAPVEINETNFTDETFRNYVSSNFDLSQNGKLEYEELIFAAKINVNKMNIQSMNGVEYFTDLEQLSCKNNQISSINLSKNTLLNKLDMTNNQLTTLDLSKNLAMENLYVAGNQLTSLDLSNNTALVQLEASENKFTELILSNKPRLEKILCDNNQLTALNLSQCPALENLRCHHNKLTELDVSKNTVLNLLNCSYNQLTTIDASGNTGLWSLECSNNQLTALDVTKNTDLVTLDCSSNQLTALDVTKNTDLVTLDCSSNQLTALNVSNNTELSTLHCNNNQLAALNVTENILLSALHCYCNGIKGEAMDALVNSLPNRNSDYSGYLYVIYYQNEGNIMTTTQVAAAKAKNWLPYHCLSATYYPEYDYTYYDWKEYAGSDPTAIEGIESDATASKNGSDVYFDLSGRRVTAPTKGVYVKNGRKVVVK